MISRFTERLHLDLVPPHSQPSGGRLLVATAVAIVGSLAADALLVLLGTGVFPATRGYSHFRFSDYATLTVIGVAIACLGWPIVTRICTEPRWLFSRLAALVTIVLLLPDVAILVRGQPARAVTTLMIMHLAIAVVTYAALTRVASPTRRGATGFPDGDAARHAFDPPRADAGQ